MNPQQRREGSKHKEKRFTQHRTIENKKVDEQLLRYKTSGNPTGFKLNIPIDDYVIFRPSRCFNLSTNKFKTLASAFVNRIVSENYKFQTNVNHQKALLNLISEMLLYKIYVCSKGLVTDDVAGSRVSDVVRLFKFVKANFDNVFAPSPRIPDVFVKLINLIGTFKYVDQCWIPILNGFRLPTDAASHLTSDRRLVILASGGPNWIRSMLERHSICPLMYGHRYVIEYRGIEDDAFIGCLMDYGNVIAHHVPQHEIAGYLTNIERLDRLEQDIVFDPEKPGVIVFERMRPEDVNLYLNQVNLGIKKFDVATAPVDQDRFVSEGSKSQVCYYHGDVVNSVVQMTKHEMQIGAAIFTSTQLDDEYWQHYDVKAVLQSCRTLDQKSVIYSLLSTRGE